jgi:hypothetical protein
MPGFTFDGTATVSMGVASTTSGSLKLYNSASANSVSLASGNNSAAWTLTLPTSAGTNGYGLVTDGSGNTSWAAIPSGTINTGTVGQITYYSGTNTLSGTTTGTGVLTALGNNTNSASGVAVLNGSGYLAVAQGGTGLGSGTSGGVLYYSATGTLASSAALAASSIVLGGGAGVAPATTTTGTGVVTAIGNAVNTAGGLLAPATALTASAIVIGGGSGTGPSTTTTGSGVVTAIGNAVNTAGGLLAPAAALTANALVIGGGSGTGPSTTTTGTGILTFLGTPSSANLAAAVTDETGSGALVFGTNPTITNYTEAVVAIGNTGTSKTIDLTSGTVQTATLTGNCTFTMPTATAGKSFVLILNTGSSAYTATFTSVKWPNNTAPTVTTGSATTRYDIFSFFADGTNWYGSFAQAFQ